MKRTLLYVIIFLSCIGNVFTQEKPTNNIEKLTTRLSNLGTVSGAISEYFTTEELVLLQNHFNKNRKVVEENNISEMKSIMSTKAYTSGSFQNNEGNLYSFIPFETDFESIGTAYTNENAGAIDPNDPNTAYVFDSNDNLYSVNLTTGTYTLLGNIPGDWMGAEYNQATGVLYTVSLDNNLYTIDTTNATKTLVGATGLTGIPAALAINGGGAFMLDLLDDNLYSINLNTGVASLIGSIGIDANFAQGMFWYPPTGEIYLAAFNNALFDAEFRIVDTTTGQSTYLFNLAPGALEQFGWISSGPIVPGPDPQIYDTWYLNFLQSTDLNDPFYIEDIDPNINPSITILDDLSFTGEGACNTFNGTFVFGEPNNLDVSGSFISTDLDCGNQVHNDFESDLFDFLNNPLWYEFSEGGSTLHLYNGLFGIAIFQDTALSISDFNTNNIKIYPNPSSNNLYITSENYKIEKVTIYSISGKMIQEVANFNVSINVSQLSEGIYFLEVLTSEGKSVQKFIKK